MKIVAINGGLHRGCRIDSLIGHLLAVAQQSKAATVHHALCVFKNLQHCQECGACQRYNRHCVLKDDLAPVLNSLEEADVLVMGTPITGEDPTAYFKIFFDRFYSFLKNDGSCSLPPGKKAVIVLSPGASEAEFLKTVETFEAWLQPFRFSELHWVLYRRDGQEEAYGVIDAVVKKLISRTEPPKGSHS